MSEPFACAPDDVETIDIWGSIYRYRATGERTGGAYSLVEVRGRRGFETPLHSHSDEDEGFFVVDGDVDLVLGAETVHAPPGTFGFAPRGLEHGFRFASDATLLLLLTPGGRGHEGMFRAVGEHTHASAEPREPSMPSDPENVARLAAEHGTAVLGPLP